MKTIDVENIRFAFGESWTVAEKWDDSPAFLGGVARLQGQWEDEQTGEIVRVGSKAVDLVGVRGNDIYLIEVKDYRGYPIETKKRQLRELPLAIGCKVRDTVAGLIGASRSITDRWVSACGRLLAEQKPRVYVVAWIVDPALRAAEPVQKRAIWQKERRDRIEQHLSWLTRHVTVASPFEKPLADVTAENLPGAGQR